MHLDGMSCIVSFFRERGRRERERERERGGGRVEREGQSVTIEKTLKLLNANALILLYQC